MQFEVVKTNPLFCGFLASVFRVLFFHVSKVGRIEGASCKFVRNPLFLNPMSPSLNHSPHWRRTLATAWLGLILVPWAWGTHLVGGDFHYVHLGGDEYSIVLTVYRDCSPANTNGTGFDALAAVGMWDGTGTIGPEDVITMTLSQTNVSTVPVEMGNPCGSPPPELCIEKAVYTATVELPANPYGWDLVYQRCCRNPTIVNLENFGGGENAGMSLEVHIPGTDVLDGVNSSPAFQELPPVALCSNLPFVWDHSAVDPDGDDLVYSLCPPQQGGDPNNAQPNPPTTPPYVDVPYVAGFSWDDPMTADPSLTIDPNTGELTCTPTMPGQYAIGICVEEHRDGVLLSMVRRDFQFNVTTCEPTEIVLEADAVPFAAGGLVNLVPYEDALGLPAVLEYPNGETFPMAAWLANNDMAVTVDGEAMVVDAVVMEGCNDARFTIERPESESDMTDTTYLTLTGSAVQGLDFDENFYEVVMAAGETSSDITLGLEDDGFEEGVEHLRIECNYVNACDQLSSTVARVVLVDPIPIVPFPAPLSCLEDDGSQTLGYDDITGYGPFMYVWDGDPWGNATQAPGAWAVQFDSTFSFVDGSGQLAFETLVDLSITDQCGKTLLHTIQVLHPVATETALCPLEAIEFPAENDGIPIADVLYNGVSILNSPDSGVPLLANATPEGDHWVLDVLEALATSVSWYEPLSLVDTCGFVTEAMVRVRNCDIPNVFTPDDLGGNNSFRIRGLSNLEGTRLMVLNRYGVEVWSDQTTSNAQSELVWNGRHPNGDRVSDGHYQWVLVRPDGQRQHGSLHVFRTP